MPSSPLRIAVLECDTPQARTRAKYGGYGGLFRALLQRAHADQQQPALEITAWDVVGAPQCYPRLQDIDGLLISGSRHSALDDHPWILTLVEFVRRVLAADDKVLNRPVPVFGVCFGHQIVGRALGSKVVKSELGWETSVLPMDLTERGKEIFGREVLGGGSYQNIHQMHRDIITDLPRGVEDLGSTSRCRAQGMYIPQKLISVQGHPEFDEDVATELMHVRHGAGIFDDDTFEDGMSRVGKPQDGALVAKAFLRLMLER